MSVPLIYQNNFDSIDEDYVPRTEQIWIAPNEIISEYCHISKNLYNEANYIIRQEYFKTGIILSYEEVDRRLKSSENYLKLPAQSAQQTLKMLDREWKGYSVTKEDYKIHPEKYLGKPKMPGYLEKNGEFVLYFTDQQVWMILSKKGKNNRIRFPEILNVLNYKIPIRTRLKDIVIKELRIIPKGIGYIIDLVYYRKVRKLNLDKDRIIGLDFGIRNVVTIGDNIGGKPIVVKGSVLKSINQFYNKRRSEIQSIYDRQINTMKIQMRELTKSKTDKTRTKEEIDKTKTKEEIYKIDNEAYEIRTEIRNIRFGPAITSLTQKRNKKIKDIMHKYSRWIINYCAENNIGTIVIGYNPEWKQEVKLGRGKVGKMNNQNFASIPHYTLKKMIMYKAEEVGISVIEQDESHTSKCSFLDEESIEHHDSYIGKRTSRGLFRSAKGMIINADVQGAYNIIKKAFPKAFEKLRADGIEGVGLHPLRINPLIVNRSINQLKLINARNINIIGG